MALTHVQPNGAVGHAVIKFAVTPSLALQYQLEDEFEIYGDLRSLLRAHPLLRADVVAEVVAAAVVVAK